MGLLNEIQWLRPSSNAANVGIGLSDVAYPPVATHNAQNPKHQSRAGFESRGRMGLGLGLGFRVRPVRLVLRVGVGDAQIAHLRASEKAKSGQRQEGMGGRVCAI